MDPNQNAQPIQQPVQPTPEPVQVQQAEGPEHQPRAEGPVPTPKQPSSYKTLITVLAIGITLILLLAGGFYLFIQQQSNQYSTTQQSATNPSPSPTEVLGSQEEQEILKIDTGDVEKDLQDLNTDVQQL